MKHFFLIGRELCAADLLLDLLEMLSSNLKDVVVLLGTEEKLMISELFRQRELHEVHWLQEGVTRA